MERLLKVLFVCHRLPERSFFYKGHQFPICARCTGILIGYFLGIAYALIFGRLPLLAILLLLFPLIIDGGFQYMQKWESNNIRRLITGILAGIGTDFLLYEIVALGFRHGRFVVQFFFA